MSSSRDGGGPSTGRSLSGWLWRVAVALVAPPLVALAVFFAGLAVDHIRTDYFELRFLLVILLCGPVAPACGVTAAVLLSRALLGVSRSGWVLAVAVAAGSLVAVFGVWTQAILRFIGVGWG